MHELLCFRCEMWKVTSFNDCLYNVPERELVPLRFSPSLLPFVHPCSIWQHFTYFLSFYLNGITTYNGYIDFTLSQWTLEVTTSCYTTPCQRNHILCKTAQMEFFTFQNTLFSWTLIQSVQFHRPRGDVLTLISFHIWCFRWWKQHSDPLL